MKGGQIRRSEGRGEGVRSGLGVRDRGGVNDGWDERRWEFEW